MAERKNLDRVQRAKGSQPVIFEDETTDALAGMVIALLGETIVLKDRLDANERLLQAAGLHGPADVENFQPDEDARAYRANYRQQAYDRVLGVARDRLLPEKFTEQSSYEKLLQDVAND